MIRYSTHTLDNGLRVVWHPDRNTSMVAVDILYNVGARDENPSRTGMAHLFEHLMFGGSEHVPDYDAALDNAGGINNAWTSNDFTNFYDILPAVNIETALWAESDRMLSPALSDRAIDIQRAVVIEEFKQVCLNRPYGDLDHHLRSLLYISHPYRYPTIGMTPEHIEAVSAADVRSFFGTHYAPNNAVLVISGNIPEDKAFMLAGKYFGDIPRRDIAPRSYRPEPPITSPRRKEVTGKVPCTSLTIAFRMPGAMERGYMECDMISDVLANGQSSRLIRDVVMTGDVITEADASIAGSEEPGYIMINARLRENSDAAVARAEELLWRQIMKLSAERVTDKELLRCHARYESTQTFGSMGYSDCATDLAIHVMRGEDINTKVERYRSITAEALQDTARTILDPAKACTLVYRPE